MAKTIKPPKTLGNFPKWSKADGPTKWVFADKPEGSRCAWSCTWQTGNGQVKPRHWDIEKLNWAQIYHELHDLAHMENHTRRSDARDLLVKVSKSNPGDFLESVKRLLRDARETYPHFPAPWSMPDPEQIYRIVWRPGWAPEDINV